MCIEWMQGKGEQVSTSSPQILQVNPPSVAPTSCQVPRGGRLGGRSSSHLSSASLSKSTNSWPAASPVFRGPKSYS